MQFSQSQIVIFAKAPVPGQVKTRLIPALGAQQACALYQNCLDYTVQQRCTADLAPVTLCATDIQHPVFTGYMQAYPELSLQQQVGQGLGARMARACRLALQQSERVMLSGSDAPALSNVMIGQALQCLEQDADVVMIPAEDGGYVLLGLCRYMDGFFVDMPWGSPQVAQLTRERCSARQLKLHELAVCWDIDRIEDVARLARHFPELWPGKHLNVM